MTDVGIFVLRGFVGTILAAHGSQKLLGWFGGPGIDGWSAMMEKMGLRPARLWAWLHALGETGVGILLAIGSFTPLAAAGVVGLMAMAILLVHLPNGLWNANGGYEFPLTLLVGGVTIGLAGAGSFALGPQTLFGWSAAPLFVASAVTWLLIDGLLLMLRRPQTRQEPA
ncbi:MAG: DoxX family protein [Anaerolineales bacterium]